MWYYVIPNQYLKPVPTSYPDLHLSVYKCIKITYSTSQCSYPILMIMSYEACIRCFHSAELFLFVLRHLSITGILALSERCKSFKTACRNRELIFNIVKYSYLMLIPGVEYWIGRPPGSNQSAVQWISRLQRLTVVDTLTDGNLHGSYSTAPMVLRSHIDPNELLTN